MQRFFKARFALVLVAILPVAMAAPAHAQDDSSQTPLGDVARSLRRKTPPSQSVIDDDNFSQAIQQAESRRTEGSALKFLMAGESKKFQVSAPDVTCSLSFSANAKSLLSGQYDQMELSPGDVAKLEGPAVIEGDALTVSLFNATDWHVSEVAVALTVVHKNTPPEGPPKYGAAKLPAAVPASLQESEIRPEKKSDTTVIYRMRAAAPPSMTAVFSAPLNLDLAPGDEWHWAIVQAKGYPPQGYTADVEQSSQATTSATPTLPAVPPSLKEPLAEPEPPVSQSHR